MPLTAGVLRSFGGGPELGAPGPDRPQPLRETRPSPGLDLVPVAGWAVKGAVAYAGTKALGEAAVRYFEARS